jgi:hypothetical protein
MSAYIFVEEKDVWIWQLFRFRREGWHIAEWSAFSLRARVERCVG